MDERSFAAHPLVRDFISWTGPLGWGTDGTRRGRLALLPIHLVLPRSTFVPVPVDRQCCFWELPLYYIWRAPDMLDGDLAETGKRVALFSRDLRAAVQARDADLTRDICLEIFEWGGERDESKGARPIVLAMGTELPLYLERIASLMNLASARLESDGRLTGVPHFNSMFAKLYWRMAADGLPIYDSRVAAAIATIVETWRIDRGFEQTALPAELRFPAVPHSSVRRVKARYAAAASPGSLTYGAARTAAAWAGATVRLGWLLRLMLAEQMELMPAEADRLRMMHCMEASLFMAGHNVCAINPAGGSRAPAAPRSQRPAAPDGARAE